MLKVVCMFAYCQVGSVNNTFGIKGVNEYCYYFKNIDDASKLRSRISESFERAALPSTPSDVSYILGLL